MRRLAFVLTDRRDADHVAVVGTAGDRAAVQDFDALGIGDARVEPARQIHRDVIAAEREAVRVDEAAGGEHGSRGGAGADVDHGGAEVGLVVGEHALRRDIGRRDHRLHGKMALLDREHQVAGRGRVDGDHVHVDAKAATEHATRIADRMHVVEGKADRQRMQHGAALAHRMAASHGEYPLDVGLAGGPAQRHARFVKLARQAAGRH